MKLKWMAEKTLSGGTHFDGKNHLFSEHNLEWDGKAGNTSEVLLEHIDPLHTKAMALIGPIPDDTKVKYRILGVEDNVALTDTFRFNHIMNSRLHGGHNTTFLLYGDNQMGESTFRHMLKTSKTTMSKRSKKSRSQLSFDYTIHVGDAVQRKWSLVDWEYNFFKPLEWAGMSQTIPIIHAPGNHDHDESTEPWNRNLYFDIYHGLDDLRFAFKRVLDWEGADKNTNEIQTHYPHEMTTINDSFRDYIKGTRGNYHQSYFSTRISGAHIIVLDSQCASRSQLRFLEKELESTYQDPDVNFVIVVVHIPPYVEYWDPVSWFEKGEKYWGREVKEEYDVLFRKYMVDLVVSGHQHNYQRSKIKDSNQEGYVAGENAINPVYAIIGGAGGTLDTEQVEEYSMYDVTSIQFHYVELSITSHTLYWTARDAFSGKIFDEFTLPNRQRRMRLNQAINIAKSFNS
ncbi:hypothetical protein H4219_002537 [Mycoemilia scoparia]|uniref:Calcineurin-like phosphoesterase domain-containing protein n=1 Tax=Mycoemilia scoparia TaxID=417184 RepID=A0A9W8DUL9_9FUNG|nr:hypothetical protein H4219_002537 [Mycoemilia scoparia]